MHITCIQFIATSTENKSTFFKIEQICYLILTQGPLTSQLGRGLHEHHNHVFTFSQTYTGEEKKTF